MGKKKQAGQREIQKHSLKKNEENVGAKACVERDEIKKAESHWNKGRMSSGHDSTQISF